MAKTKLPSIEDEIARVFERLVAEKPNVSFIYSFVYATSRDAKKAKAVGKVNMAGSAEEIAIHIAEATRIFTEEKVKQTKRKEQVYGRPKKD